MSSPDPMPIRHVLPFDGKPETRTILNSTAENLAAIHQGIQAVLERRKMPVTWDEEVEILATLNRLYDDAKYLITHTDVGGYLNGLLDLVDAPPMMVTARYDPAIPPRMLHAADAVVIPSDVTILTHDDVTLREAVRTLLTAFVDDDKEKLETSLNTLMTLVEFTEPDADASIDDLPPEDADEAGELSKEK